MLQRGMRANLQMSSTGEVKSIIVVVMCSRNGKACTKNPSIKNNCPFIMYFCRKSALIDRDTQKMNDNYNITANPKQGKKPIENLPLPSSTTKDEDDLDDDDDDDDEEDEEEKRQR